MQNISNVQYKLLLAIIYHFNGKKVLPGKLKVSQLTSFETRKFFTVFTKACHQTLS